MAFVKGKDIAKYFRARARALVKGKGRLLTFALVTEESAADASPVIIRAYYGALGDAGDATVKHEEAFV